MYTYIFYFCVCLVTRFIVNFKRLFVTKKRRLVVDKSCATVDFRPCRWIGNLRLQGRRLSLNESLLAITFRLREFDAAFRRFAIRCLIRSCLLFIRLLIRFFISDSTISFIFRFDCLVHFPIRLFRSFFDSTVSFVFRFDCFVHFPIRMLLEIVRQNSLVFWGVICCFSVFNFLNKRNFY